MGDAWSRWWKIARRFHFKGLSMRSYFKVIDFSLSWCADFSSWLLCYSLDPKLFSLMVFWLVELWSRNYMANLPFSFFGKINQLMIMETRIRFQRHLLFLYCFLSIKPYLHICFHLTSDQCYRINRDLLDGNKETEGICEFLNWSFPVPIVNSISFF